MITTVTKGTIGVAHCISYLVDQGFVVSLPLNDNQPYDLIYDDSERLLKVSVKYTSQTNKAGSSFIVELKSVRPNRKRNTIHNFDGSTVDAVFVFCENGDRYFFKSSDITSTSALVLGEKQASFKV